MEIPVVIVFLSAWLGTTWAIFRVFKEAEDVVRPKTKKAVSKWLRNFTRKKKAPNWTQYLIELFDRFYTKKHLSFKCFFRSVLSSIFFFAIFSMIHYVEFDKKAPVVAIEALVDLLNNGKLNRNNFHETQMALSLTSSAKNPHIKVDYAELLTYTDSWMDSVSNTKYRRSRDTILFLGDAALIKRSSFYLLKTKSSFDFKVVKELRDKYVFWTNQIKLSSTFKQQIANFAISKVGPLFESYQESKMYQQFLDDLFSYWKSPFLIFYLILLNFIIDYFSLLETRMVLGGMGSYNSLLSHFSFLIIDLILTGVIFFLFWNLVFYSILSNEEVFSGLNKYDSMKKKSLWALQSFSAENIQYFLNLSYRPSIVFYTTFCTSIWLWLFTIAGLVIKKTTFLNSGLAKTYTWFDVERKPFKSLGFISMIISSIVFIIWGIFLVLSQII